MTTESTTEATTPAEGLTQQAGGETACAEDRITALNDQIVHTLERLRNDAPAEARALSELAEAAARSVAHTLALQDAVAHLRRMQVLAESAFAIAVERQAGGAVDQGEAILKAAQAALDEARAMVREANNFALVAGQDAPGR